MKEVIKKHILEHRAVLDSIINLEDSLGGIADLLVNCLKKEGTVFWCGNGGSSSDSQHLAGELLGRFETDRKPLKSISLNSDSSVMTCISNDYGYDHVFERQIEGLGRKGDVLIGISTSGNSVNVNKSFQAANNKMIDTVAFLGRDGGAAINIAKRSILIPSFSTARIQEMHILIGHILCDLIERGLEVK